MAPASTTSAADATESASASGEVPRGELQGKAEGPAKRPTASTASGREVPLEPWMWEWVHGKEVGTEPCPTGVHFDMDFTTGTKIARLQQPVCDRLPAVAEGGQGRMEEQDLPLLPVLPRPPMPDPTDLACVASSLDSGRAVGRDS